MYFTLDVHPLPYQSLVNSDMAHIAQLRLSFLMFIGRRHVGLVLLLSIDTACFDGEVALLSIEA